MPNLDQQRLDILREARPGFDHAWEALDLDPDDETIREKYCTARDQWVQTVLRDVVGWHDTLRWGPTGANAATAASPDRRITITPTAVLDGGESVGALVLVIDPADTLHTTGTDGWAATPIDRMEAMLRSPRHGGLPKQTCQ